MYTYMYMYMYTLSIQQLVPASVYMHFSAVTRVQVQCRAARTMIGQGDHVTIQVRGDQTMTVMTVIELRIRSRKLELKVRDWKACVFYIHVER